MIRWFPIHLHHVPAPLAEVDWEGAVVCVERDVTLLSEYWGWTGTWPTEPWAQITAFLDHWPELAQNTPLAHTKRILFAIEDELDLGPLHRLEEISQHGLSIVQLHHRVPTRYFHPLRGVTSEGRELLSELGRLKLYLDLSHLSGPALIDVLRWCRGPRLLSHVVASALQSWSPTVRSNALDDDELHMADAELYGIPFVDDLVSPRAVQRISEREVAPLDIAHQIAHIASIVGSSRVALGADYFAYHLLTKAGIEVGAVEGMDQSAGLAVLWSELLRLGLDESAIHGVFWENATRVFGKGSNT